MSGISPHQQWTLLFEKVHFSSSQTISFLNRTPTKVLEKTKECFEEKLRAEMSTFLINILSFNMLSLQQWNSNIMYKMLSVWKKYKHCDYKLIQRPNWKHVKIEEVKVWLTLALEIFCLFVCFDGDDKRMTASGSPRASLWLLFAPVQHSHYPPPPTPCASSSYTHAHTDT